MSVSLPLPIPSHFLSSPSLVVLAPPRPASNGESVRRSASCGSNKDTQYYNSPWVCELCDRYKQFGSCCAGACVDPHKSTYTKATHTHTHTIQSHMPSGKKRAHIHMQIHINGHKFVYITNGICPTIHSCICALGGPLYQPPTPCIHRLQRTGYSATVLRSVVLGVVGVAALVIQRKHN